MSEQQNNANSDFEQRTRAAFDDSTAQIDAATRSKLTQARHAALAAAQPKSPRWWLWGLPAGLTAVLAVAMFLNSRTPEAPEPSALDDLQIVAATENLELLENVEFYAWLDDEIDVGAVKGETG